MRLVVLLADKRRTGKQSIGSDSLYYNADRSRTQELQNFGILKGTDISSRTFPVSSRAATWWRAERVVYYANINMNTFLCVTVTHSTRSYREVLIRIKGMNV